MTLDDLRDAGVLLPERQWGEPDLHTTMNKPGTIAAGAVAIGAGVAMYAGGGGAATWIGAVLFLADLFGFTWLAMRAIAAQKKRRRRR